MVYAREQFWRIFVIVCVCVSEAGTTLHKCALLLSPLEEKNETHHQRGGESIFPAPECL